MVEAVRGEEYEVCYESGQTGFLGTVSVMLIDNQGGVTNAASSVDIVESPAGSGIYCATRTAPIFVGHFLTVWSLDGTYDDDMVAVDDLFVVAAASAPLPPLPGPGDGEFTSGPCSAWTTAEDAAECCGDFTGGTDVTELDAFVRPASEVLWAISGGIYSGECGPITVRPCADGCGCWGFLSERGGSWSWDPAVGRWGCAGDTCGCSPVSEIWLSGRPRTIAEVRIDGVALDPSEYRLDPGGKLVRMRDPADPTRRLSWPGCQIIDLDDTEEGTFAIDYTFGLDPPQVARDAAAALACQLWAACSPSGHCALPKGTVRVARAGITMDIAALGEALMSGGATGIFALDLFLAAYRDVGEDPTVWSPDLPPTPRRVG